MAEVRVRFAPSPTGYLHLGSARTALFNWLYARNRGGEFILRIEDTDAVRSKKEYLDEILDSLQWLGLNWDGETYFQSKRFDIYRKYADKLLEEGKAYRDGNAIAFKMPKGECVSFYDMVHDKIEINTDELKDEVLIKSDGTPTYNFACVIDDADLKITHIIRGDDHIPNTPKQFMLYKALGLQPPKFAHMPLILGPDKAKLSKRHGATAVAEYRRMGYLPEALVNYMVLLGWSPGNNRELICGEELIKKFSIKSVGKVQSIFNIDKLNWLNSQYIRNYDPNKLCDIIMPRLVEAGLVKEDFDKTRFKKIIELFKTRFSNAEDFIQKSAYLFREDVAYEEGMREQFLNDKRIQKILKDLAGRFDGIKEKDFISKTIEEATRSFIAEVGIEGKDLIHPLRVAVTGQTVSPPVFDVLEVIGKEKVVKRLSSL
ncbi:MAG: glutamate--tRNA ligase [Candidatus Omnitrophica bacterium CG07_land_8_20_14_0_80_42_15]|uniref:Glutamate--tRNA ligase n=1 Tax=Candidatus Aquitaenariimonas noxiae TaxID=1974741 RepID=A0A2J0KUG2_9BACT|nr:MAG: glutamate--tRNA ligase [Candidatus Omnitrophica bacterium CG07_land_8_20_14_0_80_42_15]